MYLNPIQQTCDKSSFILPQNNKSVLVIGKAEGVDKLEWSLLGWFRFNGLVASTDSVSHLLRSVISVWFGLWGSFMFINISRRYGPLRYCLYSPVARDVLHRYLNVPLRHPLYGSARSFGNRLRYQRSDQLLLSTDAAHVLTDERIRLLHRLQPGRFYTLPPTETTTAGDESDAPADEAGNASGQWFDTACLQLHPPRCVAAVNRLYRRYVEAGLEAAVRAAVHETLVLAVREREALAAHGGGQTPAAAEEEHAWIGGVMAAGFGMAALALIAECLCACV